MSEIFDAKVTIPLIYILYVAGGQILCGISMIFMIPTKEDPLGSVNFKMSMLSIGFVLWMVGVMELATGLLYSALQKPF